MIFSCYGCTKRTPECHSVCQTYAEEKKHHEAERKAHRDPLNEYTTQSIIKTRDAAAKARKRHPLKPGCIK